MEHIEYLETILSGYDTCSCTICHIATTLPALYISRNASANHPSTEER